MDASLLPQNVPPLSSCLKTPESLSKTYLEGFGSTLYDSFMYMNVTSGVLFTLSR
jgi:hypothetical protein